MSEIEDYLRRLTPSPPSPALRRMILADIGRELRPPTFGLADRWLASMAAAGVALTLTFALWLNHENSARLTRALGPRPAPRNIREIVATLTHDGSSEAADLTRRLMLISSPAPASRALDLRVPRPIGKLPRDG